VKYSYGLKALAKVAKANYFGGTKSNDKRRKRGFFILNSDSIQDEDLRI